MAVKHGSTTITAIKHGSTGIMACFHGTTQVFEDSSAYDTVKTSVVFGKTGTIYGTGIGYIATGTLPLPSSTYGSVWMLPGSKYPTISCSNSGLVSCSIMNVTTSGSTTIISWRIGLSTQNTDVQGSITFYCTGTEA